MVRTEFITATVNSRILRLYRLCNLNNLALQYNRSSATIQHHNALAATAQLYSWCYAYGNSSSPETPTTSRTFTRRRHTLREP